MCSPKMFASFVSLNRSANLILSAVLIFGSLCLNYIFILPGPRLPPERLILTHLNCNLGNFLKQAGFALRFNWKSTGKITVIGKFGPHT
jgi:hypothetical protein